MRNLISIISGISLALVAFWFMQWLVEPGKQTANMASNFASVDFIRNLRDTGSDTKDRQHKEPEPPKQPPVPTAPQVMQNTPTNNAAPLNMPALSSALASFKGQGMDSMLSGYGVGDSDVMPLVQIDPVYPPQALARKLEGLVVLRMQINESGNVDDVEVIKAEPKGVFEREAIRAAYRYKFKPKLVDGKPAAQVATLPFEFKLEK
jgi:periplasmic protein TonB